MLHAQDAHCVQASAPNAAERARAHAWLREQACTAGTLTKARAVVVAQRLGIAKRLQDGVGLLHGVCCGGCVTWQVLDRSVAPEPPVMGRQALPHRTAHHLLV
jgi:hypothetical protein